MKYKLLGILVFIFLAHCINLYIKKKPEPVLGHSITDINGVLHRYPRSPQVKEGYQYCYEHQYPEQILIHWRPNTPYRYEVSKDDKWD
tara:strand:- start:301 stop:564 length:264 start_codon:yes stop_codon:yes gene_type:complete